MAILSSEEFIFQKIIINGKEFSPDVAEIITPEMEDPYWEISYASSGGSVETVIFATGEVFVEARPKELKVIEGGKKEEPVVRRLKRGEQQ
jgi:hypothetical protein